MDFQVKFTEQGAEDLYDVIKYLNDVLLSPAAAERFYNEVDIKRNNISKNPFMYPLSRDERLSAEGYRTAVIGNYLLFYVVEEAVSLAYIVRIVYGRRDLTALLEE